MGNKQTNDPVGLNLGVQYGPNLLVIHVIPNLFFDEIDSEMIRCCSVTDLIFLNTGDRGFATASHWLIGFGIGTALLAAAFGLIDYMGDDRIRRLGVALQHMMANVAAVVVSIINFAIRLGDPGDIGGLGVYLSGAVVLILLYSGWLGGEMVYRHRVAVQETPDQANS